MSYQLELMRTVAVQLRHSASFRDVYLPELGQSGGILLPPSVVADVGESLCVDLSFQREQVMFHTAGIARWRRTKAQANLPPGVGMEFTPDQKRTRDRLLAFATGAKMNIQPRGARRHRIRMVVEYHDDSVGLTDLTADLSASGCFVATDTPQAPGSVIDLRLRPPGGPGAIDVTADVVWARTDPPRGMGLRFRKLKRGPRKKLEELLKRIEKQLAGA